MYFKSSNKIEIKAFVLLLFIGMTFWFCSKEKRYLVTTEAPTNIKARRVTLKGLAKSGYRYKIVERGFCYSSDHIPALDDNKTRDTIHSDNSIEIDLKNLKLNTTYNAFAFSKLNDGTFLLGKMVQFTTNSEFEIGDIGPANGIVFNKNSTSGAKFRFAEARPIPNLYSWGCPIYETFADPIGTLTSAWGAEENSNKIALNCASSNIAAKICLNLELDNFSDWLLPTGGDLTKMYESNQAGLTDIFKGTYWSSSEYDAAQGYGINLDGGIWGHYSKSAYLNIMAVRYFN